MNPFKFHPKLLHRLISFQRHGVEKIFKLDGKGIETGCNRYDSHTIKTCVLEPTNLVLAKLLSFGEL